MVNGNKKKKKPTVPSSVPKASNLDIQGQPGKVDLTGLGRAERGIPKSVAFAKPGEAEIRSRPLGTDPSKGVRIDTLSPQDAARVQSIHAAAGRKIQDRTGLQSAVLTSQGIDPTTIPELGFGREAQPAPEEQLPTPFLQQETPGSFGAAGFQPNIEGTTLQESLIAGGLATAAAGAGALGLLTLGAGGAGVIAPASAAKIVGGSIAKTTFASLAAKATAITTPALLAAFTLEKVGVQPFKDKAGFIQQSYNTLGELASSDIANSEVLTGAKKLDLLNNMEDKSNLLIATLKQQTIENKRLAGTKEMVDLMTDAFEKQFQIIESKNLARAEILSGRLPEFTEETINNWVATASQPEIDKVQKEYNKQLEKILKLQGEID